MKILKGCVCVGGGGGGLGGGVGGVQKGGILCVCSGAFKNGWGQWEGVKSGYRTKGLITWAGLASFAEIPASQLNATTINSAILWQ